MNVGGQPHAPVALLPEKELLLPTGWEAESGSGGEENKFSSQPLPGIETRSSNHIEATTLKAISK
jgi:hypothetical protein